MPIWLPLTVLFVAPITIWIVTACIDMQPLAAASLAIVVPAGAALVLVNRISALGLHRAPHTSQFGQTGRGSRVVHARLFSP